MQAADAMQKGYCCEPTDDMSGHVFERHPEYCALCCEFPDIRYDSGDKQKHVQQFHKTKMKCMFKPDVMYMLNDRLSYVLDIKNKHL